MRFSEIIPIGLMLFASFFGAGNLIFPPAFGQLAGDNYLIATIGFCITGVGLPLLGIIAIGRMQADNPDALAMPVGATFAKIMTVITTLAIGPLFAIPRTGAVSFDVGVLPFVSQGNETIGLALYTLFFFGLTFLFSFKESNLIDLVGKLLTPLLLISIAVLILQVVLDPMGALQKPVGVYENAPFAKGFQEGYHTMDLLATLLFGSVVVEAIKLKGIVDKNELTRVCIASGVIAAVLLAVIYLALAYTGATSVDVLGISDNGGIALSQIAFFYLGRMGNVVLCLMIFFACLTTSIGLTAAASAYFNKITNGALSYKSLVTLTCVMGFAVSNVGLSKIIAFSIPILCLLYPIMIVLVLLGNSPFKSTNIYRMTMTMVIPLALLDGVKAMGVKVASLDACLGGFIPWYDLGFGWVVPGLVGVVLGMALDCFCGKK